MKKWGGMLAVAVGVAVAGCNQSGEDRGAYSRDGGGSLEGAGGAGPGYDGTGSGRGEHGTVPESGAVKQGETGHSQTNMAIPERDQVPSSTGEQQ